MNEILKFIVENWVTLSSTIGMVILWFSKRKYDKVEFKKESSIALDGIESAYNKFVLNTNAKFEEFKREITDLKEKERQLEYLKKDKKKMADKLLEYELKRLRRNLPISSIPKLNLELEELKV